MVDLVLLGPQRLRPTLARVAASRGLDGKVAAVTAGWQEREEEDDELREHLAGRAVNLRLYQRAEEVFADDPKLFEAHRERQDRVRRLQELYRRRLDHALEAVRELFGLAGEGDDTDLLLAEREAALAAVRALDARHLEQIDRLHRRFERQARPRRRASLRRHREELARELSDCQALAIAGGHVAVLLNRLRLFGLLEIAGELPILAWSAGAMALADRVVVFHDSPPQGAGNTEVLERGLGLIGPIQPFPHARRRLRLRDPVRVAILARRLEPAILVALDEGDGLAREAGGWRALAPARRLLPSGEVRVVEGPLE